MKPNELMIGDWVCYDGDTDYEYPVKVDGIGIDDISIDGDGFLGGLEGRVIPIPLTEEILEANGWKRFRDIKFYYGWHYGESDKVDIKFGISSDDNKSWAIILGLDDEALCWIKYVHELQNVLRICKLDEQADNFKLK